MILIIDNYDSFVHNLARYARELGEETLVMRNDAVSVAQCRALAPRAVIISPGPSRPENAGICKELISASPDLAILGVCLGHQCLVEACGGRTVPARSILHGRSSEISHDGAGIFAGLASPMTVGRYHSLSVDLAGSHDLEVQATAPDGEVMAVRHKNRLHVGVQFHPESLLTENGQRLLQNFLNLAGAGA